MKVRKGIIVELIDSGLYTVAKNPWLSGKLKKYAEENGFDLVKILTNQSYIRKTPPWATMRDYFDGASDDQLEVWYKLKEIAKEARKQGVPASVLVKKMKIKGGQRKPPEHFAERAARKREESKKEYWMEAEARLVKAGKIAKAEQKAGETTPGAGGAAGGTPPS